MRRDSEGSSLPKRNPSSGSQKTPEPKQRPPYEATHKLQRLLFAAAIVPNGQAGDIADMIIGVGAAACFISHGKGTATQDFYEVLGLGENHKQIIVSLITEPNWFKLKGPLTKRFAASEWGKGVAFALRIDSICGVTAYRMMADDRGLPPKGDDSMATEEPISKKDDYEVVAVIVNDGYTDLVMDAARRAGAKGGTIITARGTGNKDIEKFFGVVITPEKQIVIILVPRRIKDDVISAVCKEAGLSAKGQGIAFSMPAADVVGIVEETPETKDQSEKTAK
jgi:nitrogen regulatory protein PII